MLVWHPKLSLGCPRSLKGLVNFAIINGFQRLGYDGPNQDQALVVCNFVAGRDVFVMLPTGSGKLFCAMPHSISL